MRYGDISPLTSTLLFPKGGASTTGFAGGPHKGRDSTPLRVASSRPTQTDPNAPIRLSLKLDRARHQHLKLAAARLGMSHRELLGQALDHYLRTVVPTLVPTSCACLAQVDVVQATAAILSSNGPSNAESH
jgi:hypothetical protein